MPTKITSKILKPHSAKTPRKPRGSAAKPAKAVLQPKADQPPAGAKTSGGKKASVETKPAALEPVIAAEVKVDHRPAHHAPAAKPARYIFATGRRKTAVANVRLFEGKGELTANKHPLKQFFAYTFHFDEVIRPLEVTGLVGKYHFTAHINGGGPHSQAQALRHGVSVALGKISPEIRKVLKKNGFLTRDDRKKERKKPGLKRARRSPQWAKR